MSQKYIFDLKVGDESDIDIHPYHEIENLIFEHLDLLQYYKSFILVNKYYYKLITRQELYIKFKECSNRTLFDLTKSRNIIYGPNFIKSMDMELILFWNGCVFGWLDVVKYLYQSYTIDVHFCNNLFFTESCEYGRLEIVKFLLNIDKNIYDRHGSTGFILSCKNNHLDIVKYLYGFAAEKYGIPNTWRYTFHYVCANDYLDMAKWLYSLDDKLIVSDILFWYNLFDCCIEKGLLEVSKWLYSLDNGINTYLQQNSSFSKSCRSGNLELVKWIYSLLNGKVILNPNPETLFQYVCEKKDNIEIAKFLLELGHNTDVGNREHISGNKIDIHGNKERAFRRACLFNNIKMAKWLYQVSLNEGNPIDIRVKKDYAFRKCNGFGNQQICRWLATLCDKYRVIVIPNDELCAVFHEKN